MSADVLIVGGGIQGLWILKRIQDWNKQHARSHAPLNAILVEHRQLGSAQSGHSHGFLHSGYTYKQQALAERISATRAIWDEWLQQNPVPHERDLAIYGFDSAPEATRYEEIWKSSGLAPESVRPRDLPDVLRDGSVVNAYRTQEFAMDCRWLVQQLAKPLENHISRINLVESIHVSNHTEFSPQISSIDLEISDACTLKVRVGVLVLAAGWGNQQLLDLAASGRRQLRSRVADQQQLRLSHMLLIEGPSDLLPPFTGIFPNRDGVFVVSRRLKDTTIWMVSDHRSEALIEPANLLDDDAGPWLPRLLLNLRDLAPSVFKDFDRFRWAVYSAAKAEPRAHGALPEQMAIEQFGFKNLFTVWPVKFSLAPHHAEKLVESIHEVLGNVRLPHDSPTWTSYRRAVPIADEKWTKCPRVSWEEFKNSYGLDSQVPACTMKEV